MSDGSTRGMDIKIELDRTVFEPGDTITGRVRWGYDGSSTVRVSLIWHTEGKGTEDTETVAQKYFRTTAKRGSTEAVFAFRAPLYPWSFSGTLISLVWAVEASLEPRGDLDRIDVTVAPEGRELRL